MRESEHEFVHQEHDGYIVPNLGGRTFSRDLPAEFLSSSSHHKDATAYSTLDNNNLPRPSTVKKVTWTHICRISIVMLAYALFYTLFAGNQTVSSLAAKRLASTEVATVPTVAMFTGAIIVVVPASFTMQTYGRRVGFLIGGAAAILSGCLSYFGIRSKNFPMFTAAGFLLGIFDGFADYLRFAAAEAVSESFQGAAVSIALSGGAVCSVLGPYVASIASHHGGYGLYYLVATGIALFFCFTVSMISNPKSTTSEKDDILNETDIEEFSEEQLTSVSSGSSKDHRGVIEIIATPKCFIAILCGMAAQWAMILIMTALPLGMVDLHDFNFTSYTHTIQLHLLAMFVPGLLTGMAADRFGPVLILVLGHATVLIAIYIGLRGYELVDFTGCLVVLGLGWNLLAIGSTKLLLSTHTPAEAHSVQAAYELFVFIANGGGAYLAGFSIDKGGWRAVMFNALPLTVVAAALTLLLGLSQLIEKIASFFVLDAPTPPPQQNEGLRNPVLIEEDEQTEVNSNQNYIPLVDSSDAKDTNKRVQFDVT